MIQQTCLLCDTADMSAVSHSRHVCCATRQACLLCRTTESPQNKQSHNNLPRRANLYGSANFNYYVQDWIFGLEQIGSRGRDTTSSSIKTKGYMITNLVTNYVFNEKFTINIRLDNALDKDYALSYEGPQSSNTGYVYQTPGRSLSANLRYDF